MESKKINQLATSVSPQTSDLTIIGDPTTGVSKKITLLQIANLFATTGTVSSVAVTESGDALTITGSPITSAGTINIGFAGDATQYVRGDGALADFPTSTGGGSSVSYYLNSSVSQGTIMGISFKELSKDPISGAGTDITISSDGYVAGYITDANDPSLLEVPGGNFNCEFYFSVNNNTGNPSTYAELYKYDGTNFTLLGTNVGVPEFLTQGTTIAPYYFAIPVATAALSVTDRLAIRIYVEVDGRTVTLHTENNHLCQVVTTFSKGLISLNNLTRQNQFFGTGTSGTDFAISSSVATHTFNLPVASAANTGKLSSTDWSTFNNKLSTATAAATYVPYSGATANVDLGTRDLTSRFIYLNGIGTIGGHLFLRKDVDPAFTLNYTTLYSTDNNFGIGSTDGTNTKKAIFSFGSLTDNTLRTYTLPDASGTIALTSDLSAYVTLATNQTITGAKIFTSAITNNQGYILKDLGSATYVGVSAGFGGFSYNNTIAGFARYNFSESNGSLSILNFPTSVSTKLYTFPDANGTIALTSDLSAYLPLTGGTLTGALSGTSATFSGVLTLTNGTTSSNQNATGFSFNRNTSTGAIFSATGFAYQWQRTMSTTAASDYLELQLYNPSGAYVSSPFTIYGNGAATFTGALSGTSATFSSSGSASVTVQRGNTSSGATIDFNTSTTNKWFMGLRGLVNDDFYIFNQTAVVNNLILSASTGAATFSNLAGTGSRAVIADASGTLSAPVSDISVKENIKPIGYGLNEILKMNPVWFDFIDEYKNYGEGRQNGNIAQEMELIIPEAVFTTPSTGKMGINYDQLHSVYIKAIQDLEARIKQLENK